ncbi:conserved unknown protein [Ectocarpus siliculosus]|uniref:FYVE-type domain-containing protein n=1 Tax=Ectocarpus siliculosus TaxID=2880 RepID=D7FQG5_ECTSI|nr:conserved unknown protein [Ectocarpus siliculosus]|eukprot:CBJ48497.1 conserved unknown protein [Ectocarpus siliculosus]
MQRVPPAVLASYRALYVVLRGHAAAAEDEINRDIMRTVRGTTGLLLDLSSEDSRSDFAGSINRVLNALAHVDNMGYCQGQNYVVDVMMKAGLPERETFCLFLYLLRQGHFHGMYRKEVAMLAGYMDKLEGQLRGRLPDLAAHFEAEHYPPPLYALEWITTFFGLAAQPLVSLVALDLFLAGARNPVLRLCVSLLGEMEQGLLGLDQEGLLKDFRSRAVGVDAEGVIVRALSDGGKRGGGGDSPSGGEGVEAKRSSEGGVADAGELGWSTGPDYLLVLRSRHCQTLGLVELREEAKSGLIVEHSSLQDALLAVTRSLGWDSLRTCWLETCLAARSDHERHTLASQALRFVIANGGHVKAASFMLGVGGADANEVDSRLLSPLHLVAMFNRPDIARVLLMCGASPRLVGGVTRAAAARGGKLWSPLEMAEEACTEGGALDDGAALGGGPIRAAGSNPARAWELGGRGAANVEGGGGGGARPGGGGGGSGSGSSGPGGGGGRDRLESATLWELGSAIGDDWEELFNEGNANARGGVARGSGVEEDSWKPGGLRRPGPGTITSTEEIMEASVGPSCLSMSSSPVPWETMPSVLLGTWERRPQTTVPKDRHRLFDNSAAFVRACFPAQTWLQHHMEEEMGLSLGGTLSRHGWGGPFKGLGMDGEHFNPEIMQAASSTGLHRHMSWVMAESGVPWEANDDAWCCPECFILFSLNVFRHHCRGCGQVYCSAHTPPTPVPSDDRPLKLCWSCVLEGAVPLPASLVEEEEEEDDDDDDVFDENPILGMSPSSARGIAAEQELLSPTVAVMNLDAATAAAAAGAAYIAPPQHNPDYLRGQTGSEGGLGGSGGERKPRGHRAKAGSIGGSIEGGRGGRGGGGDDDERKQRGHKKAASVGGSGFLSALVSLIEVVASPTSPMRSRGGGGGGGGKKPDVVPGRPPQSPAKPLAVAAETGVEDAGDAPGVGKGGGQNWRAGWSTLPASGEGLAIEAQQQPSGGRGEEAESSPLRLRKEYDSGSGSRTQLSPLRLRKEFGGFNSHSTGGSLAESVDDGGGANGNAHGVADGAASFEETPPPELGFPSERPWALGFGN